MWIWAFIIVTGICALLSLYMSFLAFRLGDAGALLFLGFGLLLGLFFVISGIKIAAGKFLSFKKIEEKFFGEPESVSFVPHRFIMSALIITGAVILIAILMPLFFK